MLKGSVEKCGSCQGEGEVSGITGPESCPDCGGIGQLPSAITLAERRLRELESTYARQGGEVELDVRWLVGQVRRSRHALVQIMAAGQDADPEDPLASQVQHLANGVLGVYPAERE
jgi:hypothetical protein